MAVAMMVDNPNGSQEVYERLRALIDWSDRPADLPPRWPSPDGGWRVIEVWESEEDAQRFFEDRVCRLGGGWHPGAPTRHRCGDVHNYIS